MRDPLLRLRARVEALLPRGQFMRNVAVLTSGTAVGQLAIILSAPVLTRLYTPEDFGVLNVFVSIASLAIVVACLRYEAAIPVPKDDEAAASLLGAALLAGTLMSLLTGALVYLLRGDIVAWTHQPRLGGFLWVLPLVVFGAAVYNALNYWAVRRSAFGAIARTKIYQSLWQVIGGIGGGLLKMGSLGLITGFALGQVSGNGTLWLEAWRRDRELLRGVRLRAIASAALLYRDFPRYAAPAALLNIAPKQLPGLLIAAHYGPHPAGLLDVSQRLIRIPMTVVSSSVGQVFMGKAAEVANHDPARLRVLFSRTVRQLLLVGIGPMLLLMLIAPWVCAVALGAKWAEAGVYIRIIIPSLLLEFVVSTVSPVIYVVQKQAWQVAGDIVRFSLITGALLVAFIRYPAEPLAAVVAYAATMFITYAAFLGLYAYAVRNHTVARTPSSGVAQTPPSANPGAITEEPEPLPIPPLPPEDAP